MRGCIVQTTSNVGETTRIFCHLLDAEVSGRPRSWYIALGNGPIDAKGSRTKSLHLLAKSMFFLAWATSRATRAACLESYTTQTFTTRDEKIAPPDGFSKTRQFSGIVATSRGAQERRMPWIANHRAAEDLESVYWWYCEDFPASLSVPSGLFFYTAISEKVSSRWIESPSTWWIHGRLAAKIRKHFGLRQTEVPRSEMVWVKTKAQWLVRMSPRQTQGSDPFDSAWHRFSAVEAGATAGPSHVEGGNNNASNNLATVDTESLASTSDLKQQIVEVEGARDTFNSARRLRVNGRTRLGRYCSTPSNPFLHCNPNGILGCRQPCGTCQTCTSHYMLCGKRQLWDQAYMSWLSDRDPAWVNERDASWHHQGHCR